VSQQCELIGVKTNLDKGLKFYAMGNAKRKKEKKKGQINALNAELNPICHFLALLGAHPIFHVSRIRAKRLSSRLK